MRCEQWAQLSLLFSLGAAILSPWRPRGVMQWSVTGLVWVMWQRWLASGFRTWTIYPFFMQSYRGDKYWAKQKSSSSSSEVSFSQLLKGHLYIVTGAGVGGIGFWTAAELYRRGAHVIITGRSKKSASAAAQEMQRVCGQSQGKLIGMALMLSDPSSIMKFAKEVFDGYEELKKASGGTVHLAGLVNNAGAIQTEPTWTYNTLFGDDVASSGVEVNVATNFLGPMLLTQLLLPLLLEGASGSPKTATGTKTATRLVNVASQAHRKVLDKKLLKEWMERSLDVMTEKGHAIVISEKKMTFGNHFQQYGLSKFGNMANAYAWGHTPSSSESSTRINKLHCVSLHPGVAWGTNVTNDIPITKFLSKIGLKFVVIGAFMLWNKTPLEASATSVHCVLCPEGELVQGGYYVDEKYAPEQLSGVGKQKECFMELHEWGEGLIRKFMRQ